MKKQQKITDVGEELEIDRDNEDTIEISIIQQFINEANSLGATHIQFSGSCYDGYVDTVNLQSAIVEYETDESYHERLREEKRQTAISDEYERKQEKLKYLELKEKFEGK